MIMINITGLMTDFRENIIAKVFIFVKIFQQKKDFDEVF